jgi:hypothetical protein
MVKFTIEQAYLGRLLKIKVNGKKWQKKFWKE